MKKVLAPIIFLLVLVVTGLLGLLWWNSATSAPSGNTEEVLFTITKGASAEKIGNNLAEAGLIRNTFALKLYLQSNGLASQIPPGQFRIPKNLSLSRRVELLMAGPTILWVTIPEGYRREQIPGVFAKAFELTPTAAQAFEEEFLVASGGLEGYLYPDTYLFPPDATPQQAVSTLRNTFTKKFAPTQAELAEVGLTVDEAVALASIIERETRNPEERPVVAGIYFNRLKADWPLQADATLQYVLGDENEWWPNPTAADKEVNSFYNTYKYPGLPPFPIANPGLTSLEAVAKPQNTEYWYYLHDPDGAIHFAETLEEHNANISKYLK